MNHKCYFIHYVICSFILTAFANGIGGEETCVAADSAVPTSRLDYLKFVQDLQDRSQADLNKMTNMEQPMVALHAEWILMRNADKEKNEALSRPLSKKLGSMLKDKVPNLPEWFVDTLTRSNSFNKRYYFHLPPKEPTVRDTQPTFDTAEYDKSLRSLFEIAKIAKLQLERDFGFEDEVYARCGYKSDSGNSVFVHKYGRNSCGKHIVAFDGEGVRWVQRTFHSSISQNAEPDNSSRAELVVHGKTIWLFAISYSELMVEGCDIETGQPTFRLNSLLIDTAVNKKVTPQ